MQTGGSKWRRPFGRRRFVGERPEDIPLALKGFAGGLDLRDRREDIEPNSSADTLDMEVDGNDQLIRQDGISTVEQFAGRTINAMLVHASLNFKSELLFLAPPFIGVKAHEDTVWHDVGLSVNHPNYRWTNHGGELILSNGRRVYSRQPRATTLTEVSGAPQAAAYASFAARVFALGTSFEGDYEPLGVMWSGASSKIGDWDNEGAGFELLISDVSAGDRGVALKPMNLDFMAVFMRRSIWVGRRTGQVNRPVDFSPRVTGVGAVNEATCKTTPGGVLFLSDTGVRLFDGNQAPIVSHQINPDLLPLDQDNLGAYSASFDPQLERYYLHTPTETWILDMKHGRWYKKGLVAQGSALFADQYPVTTWDDLVGNTWDSMTETWADFIVREDDAMKQYFLADVAGVPTLGVRDGVAETYFGEDMNPYWEFRRAEGLPPRQLFTTKRIQLEYTGYGTIQLYLPNTDGDMELFVTQALSDVSMPRVTDIGAHHTGRTAGLRLHVTAGKPRIKAATLMVMARSWSQEPGDFLTREYQSEF